MVLLMCECGFRGHFWSLGPVLGAHLGVMFDVVIGRPGGFESVTFSSSQIAIQGVQGVSEDRLHCG